jgi:protein O-GlcNAc transferase
LRYRILARFDTVQDIFAAWLRILAQVPRSILWLLRFPAAGEEHLIRTAKAWAGDEIASRVHFTDVASKEDHIQRCRVADLFLDTIEASYLIYTPVNLV